MGFIDSPIRRLLSTFTVQTESDGKERIGIDESGFSRFD